jgi:hypothetical protein
MIDRYTKAVLTVIAVAVVALAIQGAVNQSHAQLNWSAPFGMDRRDAVQMATCRACSSSNLAGLLYPSAEWRRLAL